MSRSPGQIARPDIQPPGSAPGSDPQTFVVDRKIAESDSVTSFYLVPKAGGDVARFRPGQYLTLLLDLPGSHEPLVRTYTVSDCWRPQGYRISVKRERSNNPEQPDGQASNFLHDRVQPGDCLRLRPPRGAFTIDPEGKGPVVFLSAGVGVTPMISMLNSILDSPSGRKLWFLHGCRHGGEHAFGGHVRSRAAQHPNLRSTVCFSRPRAHEVLGKTHDFDGRVSLDLLRDIVPFDGCEFYLCGPADFISDLYRRLGDLGVSRSRLHYEYFGPAKDLEQDRGPVQETGPKATSAAAPRVRFLRSGKEVSWDDSYDNLLEFAEASGLAPNFSCRSGICETCMCGLVKGEVDYVNEPLERPGAGQVLICSAKPTCDIELDL